MPGLIIKQNDNLIHDFLPTRILLDGKILTDAASGEISHLVVPPGNHTLQAKTPFLSSKEITFTARRGSIHRFRLRMNFFESLRLISLSMHRQ